jgi:glucose/arabinose dehydrogenase
MAGDGIAETREVFISGLHSLFGMALVGGRLYGANADAVLSFPCWRGETRITAPGTLLVALPGGPINHHGTQNLLASASRSFGESHACGKNTLMMRIPSRAMPSAIG